MIDPEVKLFLQSMKLSGERRNVPNISWSTGDFLQSTIEKYNIASVFEIGSANGFSSIILAEALKRNNGKLTSVDLSRNAFEEAVENFDIYDKILAGEPAEMFSPSEKTKHDNSGINNARFQYIDYYFANAIEMLDFFLTTNTNFVGKVPEVMYPYFADRRFDMVFIDGRFKNTLAFYQGAKKVLNPNGIIIIDDVVKYKWKMQDFYDYLETNAIPYSIEMTDSDDGVMILL